jgi:uncharacterized membrane protein YfcA
MELIIYLLIGAIAGFTAGLFGVGGGLIIVPILYIVFTQMHYDPNVIMHIAVGTSLATIIVTSISSVTAHHKKGAVLWNVFRNLAPGLVLGSFLGAGVADLLSGQHLQLIIGVFAVWMSYKMFSGAHAVIDPNRHLPSAPLQFIAGGGIGVASAIFGIGGGSLTVPYLNRHGVVMQKQWQLQRRVDCRLRLLVQSDLCGLVQKNKLMCQIRLVMFIFMLFLVLVQ